MIRPLSQKAGMESVQVWVLFQGFFLCDDILQVLIDVEVFAAECPLPYAACQCDTHHAVEVRGVVVVDVEYLVVAC